MLFLKSLVREEGNGGEREINTAKKNIHTNTVRRKNILERRLTTHQIVFCTFVLLFLEMSKNVLELHCQVD